MFDTGFSEIIVCFVVGLVVIGPERLPEAVRTTGLWIGRFKRSLRDTRDNVERQLGMEEVRRQLHQEEIQRTLASMEEEIETALNYERMGKKPAQETLSSPAEPSGMQLSNAEPSITEPSIADLSIGQLSSTEFSHTESSSVETKHIPSSPALKSW